MPRRRVDALACMRHNKAAVSVRCVGKEGEVITKRRRSELPRSHACGIIKPVCRVVMHGQGGLDYEQEDGLRGQRRAREKQRRKVLCPGERPALDDRADPALGRCPSDRDRANGPTQVPSRSAGWTTRPGRRSTQA